MSLYETPSHFSACEIYVNIIVKRLKSVDEWTPHIV